MSTYRSSRFNKSLRKGDDFDRKASARDAPFCTILNAVKNCDTSVITGPDLNKLAKQDFKLPDISAHASAALVAIRKKHDQEKMSSLNREQETLEKKNLLDTLKKQEEQLTQSLQEMNRQELSRTEGLNKLREDLDQMSMQENVYAFMVQRTQNDIVVYKNRLNKLSVQLRRKAIFNQQQEQEYEAVRVNFEKAHKMRHKIKTKLEEKKKDLQEQLEHKQGAFGEVLDLNTSQIKREEFLAEVAERVMQEKDGNQKKYNSLFLTHKLLASLLKDKMQRQMNRFKLIEDAFKDIKIATGVNQTEDLVNKFLNKQAAYGQLLFKIAENQQKIQALKTENKALLDQRKILSQEMTLFQPPDYRKADLTVEQKRLKETQLVEQQVQITNNKLNNWLRKTARKYQIATGQSTESTVNAENLKQFLEKIGKLLASSANDQKFSMKVEELNTKDYLQRNVRIARKDPQQEDEEQDST